MNLITKLLPVENIALDADLGSKKRVFELVAQMVENRQQIPRGTVFDSLFARERLGSTGLGQGVAIPHGRIKGLRDPVGIYVRLAEPIPFDAPDGKPVRVVFALLVPDRATDLHLEILAQLAQLLSDAFLREQMAAASSPAALHLLIHDWIPDATGQRRATV
jgi:PTS system nitrogen regulatory IIA component